MAMIAVIFAVSHGHTALHNADAIFMTYNRMLESFILNRADPQWMLLALAVFGLDMAARCAD